MSLDSETLFSTGKILAGRYEFVRFLGSGGSGMVLLVRDRKFGNAEVVVKLLNPSIVESVNRYDRLRNESAVALELSHPNIAQTYSFESCQEFGYFITMEYLSGGTLSEQLQNFPHGLVFDDLIKSLNQIVNGLIFAHSKGVLHRDIKPHNLLLDSNGSVKIADFGVSRMLWGDMAVTRAGDLLGSPQYMSPEQIESKVMDGRSDIYSLGITMFELATGQAPFSANTLYDLAMCHLGEPIPQISDFRTDAPSWFQEFLNRCCHKDRACRFQSMQELSGFLKSELKKSWKSFEIERVSAVFQLGTENPEMHRRFRKEISVLFVGISFLALFLLFIVLCRTKIPLQRRVAAVILMAERNYQIDLSQLKSLLTIEVEWGDKASFFVSEYSRSRMFPLLHAGMDPNFHYEVDGEMVTPIIYWSAYPTGTTFRTVSELVEHGANLNVQNSEGQSPLHRAIRYNGPELALYLLSKGASTDLVDKQGNSVLHFSVIFGLDDVTAKLLTSNVAVDLQDKQGNTALHYASSLGDQKTVELLIARGADPNISNFRGQRPVDLVDANSETSEMIVKLLKQ